MSPPVATTEPLFADSPPEARLGAWRYAPVGRDAGGDPDSQAPPAPTPLWHWAALILITAFGGAIRFFRLDQPAMWGDEIATYARTFGSYENLLHSLGETRFMPLHYQAVWLIGQWRELTPFMMRLFPAICGTLMTPAMYFLARQMLTRRASLVAALITACSAYLFVYSRDAKMYMPLWLAVTLNMACFLWWLRTRSFTAWLGWIAAGLAAGGLHLTGLAWVALQPLMLLTQRRAHWFQSLAFAFGLAIILAGPAGYYFGFNRFGEKIEQRGWRATGISWVEDRNRGLTATELTIDSLSLYGTAYGWIPESAGGLVPEKVYDTAVVVIALMVLLLLLGAMPWGPRWRGAKGGDPPALPWWRTALWLGWWLILPMFVVYWLSMQDRIHPEEWVRTARTWLGQPWLRAQPREGLDGWRAMAVRVLETRAFFIGSAMVLVGAMTLLWRYIPRALAGAVGMALLILLFIGGLRGEQADPLIVLQQWGAMLAQPHVLTVGLAIGPALLWYFSGKTLRRRFANSFKAILVVAGVWGMCWLAAEVVSSVREERLDGSVWMPRYIGFVWPAVGLMTAALLTRLPTWPLRAAAILLFVGVNLGQAAGRVLIGNEPPIDRVAADIRADLASEEVATFTSPVGNATHFRVSGAPGTTSIFNDGGRYYLSLGDPEITDYDALRRMNVRNRYRLRLDVNPQSIRRHVDRNPQVNRVIVWQQIDPFRPEQVSAEDEILKALGEGWSLASEQLHHVRFYWTWGTLYDYRRREYVRAG